MKGVAIDLEIHGSNPKSSKYFLANLPFFIQFSVTKHTQKLVEKYSLIWCFKRLNVLEQLIRIVLEQIIPKYSEISFYKAGVGSYVTFQLIVLKCIISCKCPENNL